MAGIKVVRHQQSGSKAATAPIKVNLYGHRIWVRPLSPDYAVSVDIFDQQFNQVSQCLPSKFNGLVIDAGGYIGTAAIALHEIYPQAVIVTIEPHPENFSLLEKNISGKSNIIAIKAALVASEIKKDGNTVNIYDTGTGPWGFTVEENAKGKTELLTMIDTVDTVTLPEICNSFSKTKISIIKLDIEGSEKQLFQSNDMIILDDSFIFVELHERIMNGCDKAFKNFSKNRKVIKSKCSEKYLVAPRKIPDATISTVVTLNSCKLTGSGLKRQSKLYPHNQPKNYEAAFDADTLWYDAIQIGDQLQLICPKLNNLIPSIRSAKWWIDERPTRLVRIRFYHRYDVIFLSASYREVQRVSVVMGSWRGEANVAQPQSHLFAGLNTVITTQKNNRLDWITDFLRYYIHHHRLQGAILMDNNSTLYSPQKIHETLRLAGAGKALKQTLVVSAPFKYGPHVPGLKNAVYEEKYLQCALLNIVRLRYLSKARAVLNCDIDELAHTPKTTCFDLCVRSPLGFVVLPVIWRYSHPTDPDPTRQAVHRFRHSTFLPELQSVKYCIAPKGPTSWLSWCWDNHWLSFPELGNSYVLRLFSYHCINRIINYIFKRISLIFYRQHTLRHCFSTSTGWKSHRQQAPSKELILDAEWQAALDAAFCPSEFITKPPRKERRI